MTFGAVYRYTAMVRKVMFVCAQLMMMSAKVEDPRCGRTLSQYLVICTNLLSLPNTSSLNYCRFLPGRPFEFLFNHVWHLEQGKLMMATTKRSTA
mmetsp:Transcript_1951/g.7197  ORF Transcript_1951/g.7197 Transcript_1951/m.7197 type:complete len:95 (-) Transcript_1951:824-1108(-)